MILRRFEKILDAGFVDQRAAVVSHLDGIAVVPLDVSLDALAIFEDEDHRRLRLCLLLKIEGLGMRALVSIMVRSHRFMVRESGEIVSSEKILPAQRARGQRGANQLAWTSSRKACRRSGKHFFGGLRSRVLGRITRPRLTRVWQRNWRQVRHIFSRQY